MRAIGSVILSLSYNCRISRCRWPHREKSGGRQREREREIPSKKLSGQKKESERKNEDVKSERGRERCDEYQPGRWEYFIPNKRSWDHNCRLAVIYSLINIGNGAQGHHKSLHLDRVTQSARESARKRHHEPWELKNTTVMHSIYILTMICRSFMFNFHQHE